jgi:hypothetical protein
MIIKDTYKYLACQRWSFSIDGRFNTPSTLVFAIHSRNNFACYMDKL